MISAISVKDRLKNQAAASGKTMQGAAEGFVDKLFSLGGLKFLSGHEDLNRAVFIGKDLPVAEPLQHGVSGGPLPAELLSRQFGQLAGAVSEVTGCEG